MGNLKNVSIFTKDSTLPLTLKDNFDIIAFINLKKRNGYKNGN